MTYIINTEKTEKSGLIQLQNFVHCTSKASIKYNYIVGKKFIQTVLEIETFSCLNIFKNQVFVGLPKSDLRFFTFDFTIIQGNVKFCVTEDFICW